MPNIRENIIIFFRNIFKSNKTPMIADVTKENYNEYRLSYDTLSKVFSQLEGIDAYLIGGISAAIQTNQDLYRQNSDIDIMCKIEDLQRLVGTLQKLGYKVEDRRDIKTRNRVDENGNFHAMDHELNADTDNKNMLGIGIFTYQEKGNTVITHSYAFNEREGRVVGTEKEMPRELFELMYDKRTIDYKGMKLKTQSKEYIYMSKISGKRDKDKLDASIIEPSIDEKSREKIARIRELQAKTRSYRVLYDKDGKIESRTKTLSLEEKVNDYLDSLFMKDSKKTPEEIAQDVIKSDDYKRLIVNHPELDSLIADWKQRSINYTYQDKIKLLTKSYTETLGKFSRKSIDNALEFLHNRRINGGRKDKDIPLTDEAKEIFELMKKYEQEIKNIFVDNNVCLTHITSISPEKMEGGVLRKTIDRANNYETERVDGVFASSTPVDGNNPYIARNNNGMILLGSSTYIYGGDNIDVIQGTDGSKHAILRQPNYVYSIYPQKFKPVCTLIIDSKTHKPAFEFSEEWISDSEVDISDPTQVRGVEEVRDVTSLLEHYTILCDKNSEGVGIKARQMKSKDEAIQYISKSIEEGRIRNINKETGINVRDISGMDR